MADETPVMLDACHQILALQMEINRIAAAFEATGNSRMSNTLEGWARGLKQQTDRIQREFHRSNPPPLLAAMEAAR